jgi:hypothetical protein
MDDKRRAEQIANARREIARRIARLCTTLSEEELDRLLDRMAHVQVKYDVGPIAADPAAPLHQAPRIKDYTDSA